MADAELSNNKSYHDRIIIFFMMSVSDSDIEVMSDADLDPDYSDIGSSDSGAGEIKTRKRKRNKHLWKSVQRKDNLNKGLAYTSTSGKDVPARQNYGCSCQNACSSKISTGEKVSILNKFNDLGNKNIQDSYLFGLIEVKPVARYVLRIYSL